VLPHDQFVPTSSTLTSTYTSLLQPIHLHSPPRHTALQAEEQPVAADTMPTYLCHGFRWHRRSIRVYVVVQNIDEAAPEWIIAPESSLSILESFYSLFDFLPEASPQSATRREDSDSDDRHKKKESSSSRKRSKSKSGGAPPPSEFAMPPPTVPPEEDDVLQNAWSSVKLLEEYDPTNLGEVSRPYAYVADYVVRVDLSSSVTEEITRYEEKMARESADERAMSGGVSDEYGKAAHKKKDGSGKKAGWFEKLRDQLQRGEDIRWYVVVCGDEEREAPEEIERHTSQEAQRQRTASQSRERSISTASGGYQRDRSTSVSRDAGGDRRPGGLPRDYQSPGYSQREHSTPSLSSREFSGPQTGSSQGGHSSTPRLQQREYGTPPMPSREFGSSSQSRGSAEPGNRPKTPRSGGLRRFFGRKNEDASP
jgi:hypothetical protein